MNFEIPGPPKEIRKKTRIQKVYGQLESIDISKPKGTFTYLKGINIPFKGYIYPYPVRAAGMVKRVLKATIELIGNKKWLLLIRPKKWIKWFNSYADRAFEPYRIKENRFCKSGREIYRVIPDKRLAYNLCMIWEYEFVYRFIGQDVLGNLNKDNLKKPRKELIRLLDILISRSNNDGVIKNTKKARKAVRRLPKWVLKKLTEALKRIDIDEIKLDENDMYWCLRRPNYDHRGLTYEKKQWILKNKLFYLLKEKNPIRPMEIE